MTNHNRAAHSRPSWLQSCASRDTQHYFDNAKPLKRSLYEHRGFVGIHDGCQQWSRPYRNRCFCLSDCLSRVCALIIVVKHCARSWCSPERATHHKLNGHEMHEMRVRVSTKRVLQQTHRIYVHEFFSSLVCCLGMYSFCRSLK